MIPALSILSRRFLACLVALAPVQSTAQIESPSVSSQPEEGRTATVVLHDGQVITGTLVEETETSITLLINGIRTTLDLRQVRESYIQPPIEDRYRAVRATIPDDDAEALVQLSRWLIDKGRHDLALAELNAVLLREPYNEQARTLRVIAEQNLKLAENRIQRRDNPQEADPAQGEAPARPQREQTPAFPLLTAEDVNLMRVWEVDERNPPPIVIPREVMEDVIERYAGHPRIPDAAAERAEILGWPPAEQLRLLFALQAREFYGQVQVLEDPASIRIFRDQVHKVWLRNACATSQCHGGTEAGRLVLARTASSDPEVYYTNMYILERYRTSEGLPLLDFQQPDESLLLHMGLPRRETTTPHPLVRGWRPVFRSKEDRNYRRAAEWIDALWTPRPDYGISYDPPTAMEPASGKDEGSR